MFNIGIKNDGSCVFVHTKSGIKITDPTPARREPQNFRNDSSCRHKKPKKTISPKKKAK